MEICSALSFCKLNCKYLNNSIDSLQMAGIWWDADPQLGSFPASRVLQATANHQRLEEALFDSRNGAGNNFPKEFSNTPVLHLLASNILGLPRDMNSRAHYFPIISCLGQGEALAKATKPGQS